MNIIKQVLTRHINGISVRDLATMYSMSPATCNAILKLPKKTNLGIDALLLLEDSELNHRFNGGDPAYCDERIEDFKTGLPHFEQELQYKHMTVQLLWEEYIQDVPDSYSLT